MVLTNSRIRFAAPRFAVGSFYEGKFDVFGYFLTIEKAMDCAQLLALQFGELLPVIRSLSSGRYYDAFGERLREELYATH